MTSPAIATGVVHEVPPDMQELLLKHPDVLELWNKLTPLARNERICRVTIVKKEVTREEHLVRMREELRQGKKRPCCRPGCPHRNEKAKKRFK